MQGKEKEPRKIISSFIQKYWRATGSENTGLKKLEGGGKGRRTRIAEIFGGV